jgi:photosystem II stability/assembly factor-like uncharacterized protein
LKSLIMALLLAGSVSAQTWTALNSGITTEHLSSVFFTSPTIGYAGGTGNTMLKTTDGGASWAKLNMSTLGSTYATAQYLALHFPTASEGYAAGTISGGGVLLKTTDAGGTWVPQTLPANVLLNSFFYRNPNRQYASGSTGQIVTSAGGSTWTTLHTVPFKQLQGISFGDANTGVAVGYDGAVVRTTNGGTTWTDVTLPTAGSWTGVTFVNATTVFAVGRKSGLGAIIKSTDGGATWTDQISGTTSHLSAVSFADANTGYAVGPAVSGAGNVVLRTTNGGTTWTNGTSPATLDQLQAVHAVTPDLAYAVGGTGVIFKTGSSTSIAPRLANKTTPEAIRTWTDTRGRLYPTPGSAVPGTALPVPGSAR